MHRDLKPANILVCSNGFVKISDFGVATNDKTKGHSTFVGTTTYMSPERIKVLAFLYVLGSRSERTVVAKRSVST